MSGQANCQIRNFFNARPRILFENKLIELQQICSFANRNLIFDPYLTRCKSLHGRLLNQINEQKNGLKLFLTNMVKNQKLRNRSGRSLGAARVIIKSLVSAVYIMKPNILDNIVDTLSGSMLSF